jgi:acetolactate synthase small subunit
MLQRQLDAFAQPVARLVEPADIVPADVGASTITSRIADGWTRFSALSKSLRGSTDRRRAPRSGSSPRRG